MSNSRQSGTDARQNLDLRAFAPALVKEWMEGFSSELRICLKTIPESKGERPAIAYFPALSACCATLELLTGLANGRIQTGPHIGFVTTFARKYLPQPDFNADAVTVLVKAFRHSMAHQGVVAGVWQERHDRITGRRISWVLHASAESPAVRILEEAGEDPAPPWSCHFSHRAHIYIGQLTQDIYHAGNAYADDIPNDEKLVRNFAACMTDIYPR